VSIAVIPARGGSQRIPRKNVRSFAGRPIIAHAIDTALESRLFDRVLVSTDDPEIADVARDAGAAVPFCRPASLATDHASTLAVIQHAVQWLSTEPGSRDIESVCCLYPATPLLQPVDLVHGRERLRETGAPFVASVVAEARPIHRSFVLDGGRIHWLFPQYAASRTQDLPTVYCDAGQFYWGTTRAWLTANTILGPDTATVILPAERVIDIDTEHDWQIAEQRYLASLSAGCPTT